MSINSLLLMGAVAAAAYSASGKQTRTIGKQSHYTNRGEQNVNLAGVSELHKLMELANLSNPWKIFLETVVYNESKFNNLVGLGDIDMFPPWAQPNAKATKASRMREAQAAKAVYIRQEYLANCDHPEWKYSFGSGGWFGMLPASGVYAFKNTEYRCMDPWEVFSPAASLVMAIEFARRLMRRKGFTEYPTWANLRVGWGRPSSMGDEAALERIYPKFGQKLRALAHQENFMYGEVGKLPEYSPVALLDKLEMGRQ